MFFSLYTLVFQNSYHFQHWRLCSMFWPLFTSSISNLASFLTWSTTSSNLLTGTRKSPIPLLSATGANKTTPLHVGTTYTNDIGFHSKENVSLPTRLRWLIPDANCKHLECIIMLGTHSEPHRGQMSHMYTFSGIM